MSSKVDVLNERWKPMCERKRVRLVSTIFNQTKVDVGSEPTELNEDPGRLIPEQTHDVAQCNVEHRNRFDFELKQAT